MKDKIRENAKRYFEEELSGEPLYQDLVIDWLTDFAHEQVKLFAMPDVVKQSEQLVAFLEFVVDYKMLEVDLEYEEIVKRFLGNG